MGRFSTAATWLVAITLLTGPWGCTSRPAPTPGPPQDARELTPAEVARSGRQLALVARDRNLRLPLTAAQTEQVLAALERLKPAEAEKFKGPPPYPDIVLVAEGAGNINELELRRHDGLRLGNRVYAARQAELWPLLSGWLPPPADPPESPAYLFHATELAISTALDGQGYPPRLDLVARPEQGPHQAGWMAAIVRTFLEAVPLGEAPEFAVGTLTFTVAGHQEVVAVGQGWYRYRNQVYAHPDIPYRIYRIVNMP